MSRRRPGSLDAARETMQRLRAQGEASAPAAAPGGKRRRITVYVRAGLYAEARACVLDLGAQGREPASISALLDAALEHELVRLRKRHRNGEPWPPHRGRLPGGRPPSR